MAGEAAGSIGATTCDTVENFSNELKSMANDLYESSLSTGDGKVSINGKDYEITDLGTTLVMNQAMSDIDNGISICTSLDTTAIKAAKNINSKF